MQKYEYITETISLGLTKKGVTDRIQEKLDEKSKEGWRLVKCEISDWIGVVVMIFEREYDFGATTK